MSHINNKLIPFADMFLILFASQMAFAQISPSSVQVPKTTKHSNPLFLQQIVFSSDNLAIIDALKSISNQTKLNFYVDDLPKEERIKLKIHGELGSVLDEICDKADYYWKFIKPSTIVMSRRWKDPVDFPSTSLDEIKMAVKNVLSVIPEGEYLGGKNGDVFAVSKLLYASLSSTQLNVLLEGSALGFDDLTIPQRKLVVATQSSLKYHSYFDGWRELDWQLSRLHESYFMASLITHPDAVWKYQLLWSCPGSPVSKQQNNIDENFCVRPFTDLFKNDKEPAGYEGYPQSIVIQRLQVTGTDNVDFLTTKYDCICQNVSLKQFVDELGKLSGQTFKVEAPLYQHRFSMIAKTVTISEILDLLRRPNR